MLFGFDIQLGGIGSGVGTSESDICIVVMGTDGDKRGHIPGSGSEISPNATYAGLNIYEASWDIVTGEFIISFGDSGNDELANVVQIVIEHPNRPDANSTVWNSTDTEYNFTDLDLAQWIGSDLEKSCFLIDIQPIVLMKLIFNKPLVGIGT